MLRIISGRYKNRRLEAPKSDTRPTKDMVKEALFSSIGFLNEEMSLLDLFAGSGAIALEAISRGIGRVLMNDRDKDAYLAIRKNAAQFEGDIEIKNLDYRACLDTVERPFDIIFLDPPYDFDHDGLISDVLVSKAYSKRSIIILEVKKGMIIKEQETIEIYKKKDYGISTLYYLRSKQ